MSILSKVGAWFKKVFVAIKDDADKVAITITEEIKTGLDSGVIAAIAKALDTITGHVSTEVLTLLQAAVPKALAVELAIQGLPDNPTAADITTFDTAVLTAVGGASLVASSQLWTTLAAQVYAMLQTDLSASGGSMTFAQIVALVEKSYQQYLTDQASDTQS